MRIHTLGQVRLLASAALLLIGHRAIAQTYVAPTRETIVSTTEERTDNPPVHLIFVENRSTASVTVFNVSLTGCENVKDSCFPRQVNIHVGPGQRKLVMRVSPRNPQDGFGYHFGFSWHADSSTQQALATLAAGGSSAAREDLAAMQRTEGSRYNELSRDDFAALAGKAASLRAASDSLVLAPGEQANIDRIHLLLVDDKGAVLGRTQWVRWRVPQSRAVTFLPPETFIAHAPGRVTLHFQLADEAQRLLQHPIAELEYPIVVAYPFDPHAPVFSGIAADAESQTPLACARVALEDSAQNVVAHGRSSDEGIFYLHAPRPGTYRVRVETSGWSPVYGPFEAAAADEAKQQKYLVKFVDQLLISRRDFGLDDFEHARPAAVSTAPYGPSPRGRASAPVVQGVTLGGSESMPILGILGRAPAGTSWVQFVVDSTGRVDTASVQLPAGTDKLAVTSVKSVLPRVRFSPARESGVPTCELLRMQVNFSPR